MKSQCLLETLLPISHNTSQIEEDYEISLLAKNHEISGLTKDFETSLHAPLQFVKYCGL